MEPGKQFLSELVGKTDLDPVPLPGCGLNVFFPKAFFPLAERCRCQPHPTYRLRLGIQVADCLPVLVADPQGRVAAAAHAGWRGLAAGVVEKTVLAAAQVAGVAPRSMEVWLGLHRRSALRWGSMCSRPYPDTLNRLLPALPNCLSRASGWPTWPAWRGLRLQALGVTAISGNDSSSTWCTPIPKRSSFSPIDVIGSADACQR